ncbi:MAG TPA: 16S rRNA (cytosine(1402)-N(4))-methyltransferase RsmH [Candidatus Levybacteria bacterium]|nr:16S rRNA (cytosine(1402)-N(4))-methyltransferase RsmH [Candidatus Levybacteria bacterium]
MKEFNHIPVLMRQVLDWLSPVPDGRYIDATLGGGGHAEEIVRSGGKVLGIDQDLDAIEFVKKSKQDLIKSNKLLIFKGNFRDIKQIATENKFGEVQGILFDLGVSSHQLDDGIRGFSLKKNAALDMRMDAGTQILAKDIVNTYSKEELTDIFLRYGEEENAKKIAQEIVDARHSSKIETTQDLATIVNRVVVGGGKIHPATRVFQALRIEVNGELTSLQKGIHDAFDLLLPGGKMVVISFHSLEDRIVKRTFSEWEIKGWGSIKTKKPIMAEPDEVMKNPRARSAKLRIFEKTKNI